MWALLFWDVLTFPKISYLPCQLWFSNLACCHGLAICFYFIYHNLFLMLEFFLINSRGGSGLVKLVVMTKVLFNNQQHKIKLKRFLCVKQITSSLFSNSWNQRFYTRYVQNVKNNLYRKLNFQSNLVTLRLQSKFGRKEMF